MKYVIGIDGGGTKSTIDIVDLNGNILMEGGGGPTNINSTSLDEVKNVIKRLVVKSIDNLGLMIDDCMSFCIGTAGVHGAKGKADFTEIIKSIGVKNIITVTNDAETVLATENKDVEGVVLIAGTGSIAYGIDSKGNIYRSGGWGHILGDEGSGYYIGLEGLKAALRSYDHREPYTEILPIIKQEMGIKRAEEILDKIYKKDLKKSEIAYFAKSVNKAYEIGDKKAKEILLNATKELFNLVSAVIKSMKYEDKKVTIVVNGSVIKNNKLIYDNFEMLINKTYKNAIIKRLSKSAAYGAAIIALNNFKRENIVL